MDRRRFIAGAGAGIAAASAIPMPAIAQGVRELKMVTTWPKTLPGLQSGAERVARSITALSGGRLQVKVFAAGQLVGAFEFVRRRLVRPRRYVPFVGDYLAQSVSPCIRQPLCGGYEQRVGSGAVDDGAHGACGM